MHCRVSWHKITRISAQCLAALQVIVDLLKQYGQGGNCAEHFSFTYHNSFLIADRKEAWVLETAGKYWVAERVTKGTRSISNNLSIRSAGDLRHPNVVRDAVAQGRCKRESDFDFAKLFSDGGIEDPLSPYSREGRVRSLCQTNQGKFTVETAKSILRDHQGDICMHGQFETRGSQISRLKAQQSEHWLIEHPFPCQHEYQQVALPGMVGREHHSSNVSLPTKD